MGKSATPRPYAANEAMAYGRSLRTSPIKLNLVAQLIRGLSAKDALIQLTFSRKRISGEVKKVLQSAIANAEHNQNLDVDRLIVKEAVVGKAMVMKRWNSRGRGRAARILKPFSNIRIVVKEREDQ